MSPARPHTGSAREAYGHNQAFWDEVTPVHARSEFYGVDRFMAGENPLTPFVVEEVGDVRGLSLLHLQCHFGLDTLGWARLGANVSGVDFSGASIAKARELAEQAGLEAEFVHSNIFDLGSRFDGRFDRVFTSFGVLCWIGDLAAWGRLIARALKPGGVFYIAEFHPVLDMLQDRRPILKREDAWPDLPYFAEGGPFRFDPTGDPESDSDYAEPGFHSDETTVEWFHPLSEVFGALLGAGLVIENLNEFQFITYRARQGMQRGEDGYWRFPPEVTPLPLTYSIRARKPQE